MKLFLDSDVLLDFFLLRQPFFEDAKQIMIFCESGKITGFISPIVISNIYYLMRKTYSNAECMDKLRFLLDFFEIAELNKKSVLTAVDSKFSDFEDALQNYAAEQNKVDLIVTRNNKDYKHSNLPVMSPENFLKTFNTI